MKLMQGDCLDLLATLEPGTIDLILADPPYGITRCKWDSIIPLGPLWWLLKRAIKPNGAIVMMAGQPFTSALIMSNLPMYKYNWVWEKTTVTGVLNAKKQPLRNVEDITVFYKSPCAYNPQGVTECNRMGHTGNSGRGSSENYGKVAVGHYQQTTTGYPRQILKFSKDRPHGHPTQKPVALMGYLIKTYTNPGDAVLDFSMGSGTTGVAAVRTGREFMGIELDEEYFNVARDRINLEIIGAS